MNAALVKLIASVAGAGLLIVGALDWRGARAARTELRICARAAGDAGKTLDGCPEKLSAAVNAQRQRAACEAGLKADDAWAISTSCGGQVKDRVARQRTAEHNLADARQQLAQAEQRAVAAVSRAEARATQAAERKARATAAISAAPRDGGGLITCDAECLRNLTGSAARPDR